MTHDDVPSKTPLFLNSSFPLLSECHSNLTTDTHVHVNITCAVYCSTKKKKPFARFIVKAFWCNRNAAKDQSVGSEQVLKFDYAVKNSSDEVRLSYSDDASR